MSDDVFNSSLPQFDEKLKLMVLGDQGVGKTAIIQRYCKGTFSENYISTVGIDFQNKIVNVKNKKVNLQIWDTAGQEKFRAISKNYIQSSQGFLVIYDISKRISFININNWMEIINQNSKAKFILIGNKKDLEDARQVQTNEGENLGRKFRCSFFETSAADGENIEEAFNKFAEEILEENPSGPSTKNEVSEIRKVSLEEVKPKNKKCC